MRKHLLVLLPLLVVPLAVHAVDKDSFRPQRFDWHFVPRERAGLPLKAMDDRQRAAARALLRAALSDAGYGKATNIMRLEEVLRTIERVRRFDRDPDNYPWIVFGDPEAGAPWGWRVEGHHLSLNFAFAAGPTGAVTPAFMGPTPLGTVRPARRAPRPGRAGGPCPRAGPRPPSGRSGPGDHRRAVAWQYRERPWSRRRPQEPRRAPGWRYGGTAARVCRALDRGVRPEPHEPAPLGFLAPRSSIPIPGRPVPR